MPTLLQVAAIHPDAQTRLNQTYELLHAELPEIGANWLTQHAHKVYGIVTGGRLGVPNPLMTALPNLKVIGINGVGFDKVDLELARSRGVRVANTPDVLTDDVADLTVDRHLHFQRPRGVHSCHHPIAFVRYWLNLASSSCRRCGTA